MLAHSNLHGTHHTGAYMPELAAHFGEHFPERANDLAITVKFMLVFGHLCASAITENIMRRCRAIGVC